MSLSRRTLPPLNALRAFEVAGRRLNFRAAADELGVTQGAVAQQVREQFATIPDTTLLAAIGPRTASDARKAGLPISVVADRQTVDALIEAVSQFTLPHAADEFAP